MKSSNTIWGRNTAVLLFLLVSAIAGFGQSLPRIEARFSNPRFEKDSRKYYLDVELHAKDAPQLLFGMNLRFFYDAAMMQFQNVDQFRPGYGILGAPPKAIVGTDQSGVQLFSFSHAAAYINGAVQLMDERFPLAIPVDGWVKAFRLCFKVNATAFNKAEFCPSVIWDLEATAGEGGFLPGSAGLVITVAETNRATRYVSAPTETSAVQFNWQYDQVPGLPHGSISPTSCVPLGTITTMEDQDKTDVKGISVFQNKPNPFDSRTNIEFILPSAQHVTLVLFDVDGVIKETVEGDFEAGKNQFELQQKPWMVETSVIYYRIQTNTYTSKTYAMSLVRA